MNNKYHIKIPRYYMYHGTVAVIFLKDWLNRIIKPNKMDLNNLLKARVIPDLMLCLYLASIVLWVCWRTLVLIISDLCEYSACWKLFKRTPQKATLRAWSQPSTTTAGTKNGPWTWAMIKVTWFPFPALFSAPFLIFLPIVWYFFSCIISLSPLLLSKWPWGCSQPAVLNEKWWQSPSLLGQYALCVTAHTHTSCMYACEQCAAIASNTMH